MPKQNPSEDIPLPEHLEHKVRVFNESEIKTRIKAAFSLFEHENAGCVLPEELGTIMRYLGVFPSEKDIVEVVLPEILGDDPGQFVQYDKFEPKMLEYMKTNKWEPDSAQVLLSAFRVLDTEQKGYVDADKMKELISTQGISFREKETDSFLSVARDHQKNRIYYEDYVAMLTSEVKKAAKK